MSEAPVSSKTMFGATELHTWRSVDCGGVCERVYKADEVDAEIERLRGQILGLELSLHGVTQRSDETFDEHSDLELAVRLFVFAAKRDKWPVVEHGYFKRIEAALPVRDAVKAGDAP